MCWRIQFTITKLILSQNGQVKFLVCSQRSKTFSTFENARSENGKKSMKKAIKLNYIFC